MTFYNPGMREVQERMSSTRLADRLEQITVHEALSADDRAFIESASMVFVATADANGSPDCSYKGGHPGFIRIVDDATLAIPSYDGNGQYRTLGNLTENPSIGLLFVDFAGRNRLRINGTAELVGPEADADADLVASFPGAELVVIVRVRHAFPNCPRYVHDLAAGTLSEFAPADGYTPPVPDWQKHEKFRDYLPHRRPRE